MLLGFETKDDAAVWQITEDTAAVLTVDFFTPVVDDPYEFGRIAAANALSDVFAMGAQPHVALNLLALDCSLGAPVAAEIMRGGADAAREAQVIVAGGHTVDDAEPKYGLAVFGTVHPQRIIRNAGACLGDVLYLTKALGTGIMAAALRIERINQQDMRPVIESMMEINGASARAMVQAGAHAATDITGFGLAGHLHEMLEASACAAVLNWDALPLFEGVIDHAHAYCRPSRSFETAAFAESFVDQGETNPREADMRLGVLCDPQTSGGLLVALPREAAKIFEEACASNGVSVCARIGEVCAGEPGTIYLHSEV